MDGAVHVRKIEVIAEKVDALSEGLEGRGDVVKVKVDEVMEGLLRAGVEGRVLIGAGDEAVGKRVQVWKRSRPVVVWNRSVTFDLRIAERKEAERGNAKGWRRIGVGRRGLAAGEVELYGLEPCAKVAILRSGCREREPAGEEERIKVEVDGQHHRHGYREPQHMAKEAMYIGMRKEGRGHVEVLLLHRFKQARQMITSRKTALEVRRTKAAVEDRVFKEEKCRGKIDLI